MSLTERQLWDEPIEFAMRLDVEHMGGNKSVAMLLWPATPHPLKAAERLAHCLDEERKEKLALGELMVFLRLARERGAFNAMTWIARRSGYKAPELVDLDGEERRLQLEIAHGIDELNAQFRQLQGVRGIAVEQGSEPAARVLPFAAGGAR